MASLPKHNVDHEIELNIPAVILGSIPAFALDSIRLKVKRLFLNSYSREAIFKPMHIGANLFFPSMIFFWRAKHTAHLDNSNIMNKTRWPFVPLISKHHETKKHRLWKHYHIAFFRAVSCFVTSARLVLINRVWNASHLLEVENKFFFTTYWVRLKITFMSLLRCHSVEIFQAKRPCYRKRILSIIATFHPFSTENLKGFATHILFTTKTLPSFLSPHRDCKFIDDYATIVMLFSDQGNTNI